MKVLVAQLAIVGVAALLLLVLQQALRALWLLTRGVISADLPATAAASAEAAVALEGEDRATATLRDDLDRALRALAEVRFDFATGKIDAAERDEMERRYRARAVAALRALQARGVDVQPGQALHG